ncbi:MAG TPA: ABC transporter substrate-binding protein [Gaiellaceae bacterium]|nr:ABC transporter substrate-binding protein [Gaiellaceae bacterium]
MRINRKKLGALLCALGATAAIASSAAASHSSTPGVSKKQIVIGGTFPLTGGASLYASIASAEEAYYAYVNAHGGVYKRKIKDIVLDDQYDPSQTVPAVQKLVEQDHVFAIVGSLGTAPGLATWNYLNQNMVPQVLLATGDAYWGNCVKLKCDGMTHPWTEGWQPDYPGEAKLYASYILKQKPNAKIGVLYQNDAYGKNYFNGLKTGLGTHQNQIVDAEAYNFGDSAQVVGAHIGALEAHGADTVVLFSTPTASIQSLATMSAVLHWSPLTLLNNVSANPLFMFFAEQNGASLNGVVSTTYVPSQTTQANLAGMKLAKKIIDATGNTSLENDFNEGDSNLVYGLAVGWTFVDALKAAGPNPTRAGLMHALRNLNESGKTANPFVYPGMSVSTSSKRFFPMEQLIFEKWAGQTGSATGNWKTFGKVLNSGH